MHRRGQRRTGSESSKPSAWVVGGCGRSKMKKRLEPGVCLFAYDWKQLIFSDGEIETKEAITLSLFIYFQSLRCVALRIHHQHPSDSACSSPL